MGIAVCGDLAVWGPINVTEHRVAEFPLYHFKYLPYRKQLSLMIWVYRLVFSQSFCLLGQFYVFCATVLFEVVEMTILLAEQWHCHHFHYGFCLSSFMTQLQRFAPGARLVYCTKYDPEIILFIFTCPAES